jgi:multiple sugar transport system substrate-binding protein
MPTIMPTYLQEFAFFADSLAVKTSQQALLGQLAPKDVAAQWADYMTKAQKKHLTSSK